MSLDLDYNNRQLVPRLLPSRTANTLALNVHSVGGETLQMNQFEVHNYQKLLNEWKMEKDIVRGTEILSYQIIHPSLVVDSQICSFLESHAKELNVVEREILSLAKIKVDDIPDSEDCCDDPVPEGTEIRISRARLRLDSSDPFLWCDLGYYYTVLGQKEKARRAFLTAIGLNNTNRFVVRSVARFFLHIDDNDAAHKVLVSSPRLTRDPALMSAEIAIAELTGKRSKSIDHGRRMLGDGSSSQLEKGELIAQIATLEFAYGKNAKGRILVDQGLLAPNENSLAQFEFLSDQHRLQFGLTTPSLVVMCRYEALSRSYFANSNFKEALKNAKLWLDFQPFSSKPAVISSYIAATVLTDYTEAIQITSKALRNSPKDTTLLNNLAFSYARNNEASKAVSILNSIQIDPDTEPNELAVLSATAGFVALKLGNVEAGKAGYQKAISFFRKKNNDNALARALYFYSKAIIDLDKSEAERSLAEATQLAEKSNVVEIKYLIAKAN